MHHLPLLGSTSCTLKNLHLVSVMSVSAVTHLITGELLLLSLVSCPLSESLSLNHKPCKQTINQQATTGPHVITAAVYVCVSRCSLCEHVCKQACVDFTNWSASCDFSFCCSFKASEIFPWKPQLTSHWSQSFTESVFKEKVSFCWCGWQFGIKICWFKTTKYKTLPISQAWESNPQLYSMIRAAVFPYLIDFT